MRRGGWGGKVGAGKLRPGKLGRGGVVQEVLELDELAVSFFPDDPESDFDSDDFDSDDFDSELDESLPFDDLAPDFAARLSVL